jgi:PBP1b-binding outer membrane lipoprotein LpoB
LYEVILNPFLGNIVMLIKPFLCKITQQVNCLISLAIVGILLALGGCATPIDTSPSHTKMLAPDQDDEIGGSFIESSDIRTMAQQMSTEMLSMPEIRNDIEVVRIVTGNMKNSTRHMVDTDLLLRRLRLELNRHSNGKFRFLAQDIGQAARKRILIERESTDAQNAIKQAAKYIVESKIVQQADNPIRMAVAPVANTNLFNMNADSFASLLRTKIKEQAGSKVIFAQPGSQAKVDFLLTGEFIAQSIKREGVANTVEDLKWAQNNPDTWYKQNNSERKNEVHGDQINVNTIGNSNIKIGPNATYKIIDPSLWNSPNVTKTFNIMLINQEEMAVLEKSIILEEEIKSGMEHANFILTGEISALSKASRGQRSDYVLVSFYLVDPVSNEMLWEYGYEVKRVTSRSVLYR